MSRSFVLTVEILPRLFFGEYDRRMATVSIFDPALCCSSGVCGSELDPALVRISSDLAALAASGVSVSRFNLAQQPMEFAAHPEVKRRLAEQGEQALPITIVDGTMRLSGRYPERHELEAWCGVTLASPRRLTSVSSNTGSGGGCCS